ncbi:hypothetical protein V6N13_126643 [Hibiscus sabdariffa]|uniref:DUF8041 domain-containing protein n=1 Tax=Hibiscus sabdariffa TaxID=183260 RepID=A0ABR2RFG2_9ROSI
MENRHPSTEVGDYQILAALSWRIITLQLSCLWIQSASSHEELDLEMSRQIVLSRPPDINFPLSAEPSPPQMPWNLDHCDILDVGLSSQVYDTKCCLTVPKIGLKCSKRIDSIWGAWFFFSFYFKPA